MDPGPLHTRLHPWQPRRGHVFSEALAVRLELENTLHGHRGCVNRLAWNEEGTLLASGSDDRTVGIWCYPELSQRILVDTEHDANIFGVKFLPSTGNRRLVSAGMDGTVQLHTLDALPGPGSFGRSNGGTAANTLVYRCHESRVKDLEVEPSNPNLFWSAGEDGTCRQFDVRCSIDGQGNPGSANVLVSVSDSSSRGSLELKAVSLNAVRPTQLALACGDQYVRVFDRRMLSLGSGDATARACRPLLSLTPPHLRQRRTALRAAPHTTYISFGTHGDRLVATYNGDHAYAFDVTHEGSCVGAFPAHVEQHRAAAAREAGYSNGGSKVAELTACADRATREQRWTHAIWLYTDALQQAPDSVPLRESRARALLARDWAGDAWAALRDCEDAGALPSTSGASESASAHGHVRAALLRVQAIFVLGHVEAAAAAVSAFVRKYPSRTDPVLSKVREGILEHVHWAASRRQRREEDSMRSTSGRQGSGAQAREADADDEEPPPPPPHPDDRPGSALRTEGGPAGAASSGAEPPVRGSGSPGSSNGRRAFTDRERELAASMFQGEDSFTSMQVPEAARVLQRFAGHINVQTDIKEATFLGGDSLVAVGSDDGRVWIYAADTGRPVTVLAADRDVVNAVQAHPHLPVLATSGIESTIKMWSPGSHQFDDPSAFIEIMKRNQERMREGPQLLPGLTQSVLVRLSERPEMLSLLLAHAASTPGDGDDPPSGEDRPEEACRMA